MRGDRTPADHRASRPSPPPDTPPGDRTTPGRVAIRAALTAFVAATALLLAGPLAAPAAGNTGVPAGTGTDGGGDAGPGDDGGGDAGPGDDGGVTTGGADAGPGDPPADATCTALPVFGSSWPGGFRMEVTVTNTGTVPLTGWTVHLPAVNAEQVWGGTAAPHPDGGTLVTNTPWTGAVAPGTSMSFGLIGSGSGPTDARPPVCAPLTG
ncbi:hypothetical protein GCM10027160_30870 [Streptomyces calidiresistens]|uniref:cellulose binding domain-containing protein n=1 Tax=Streptomyces calidiresistens TaxID=1485586 RepID=UPI0015F9A667|nr:cellulose binding domain-containing protein [Streptomyces calidiresistens]